MAVRIQDYCVGNQKRCGSGVFIFLKYNGLCGQVISSSQLCSQSLPCTNFRARATPFACTLCARNL